MKAKKLSVNVILNITKSAMGMFFPLITYPYVSRVLQADNIGKVNYATSIVSYFLLIAMLGIKVYATREGAQIRTNKVELHSFVSEVYSINIISGLFALALLILAAFNIPAFGSYKFLILLIGLQIPLSVIGVDWINSIFEDYWYITIRTIAFQFLSLILIFLLVRHQTDYMQYALCTVISGYGIELVNILYTKRYCKKKFTVHLNLKKHLKPISLLFTTNFASLIYSSVDTTMLGLMTTDYNVGIYSTAAKVYNIFKQLLFAIIVVCLPRFSNMLATERKEKYETFAMKIYHIVFLLSIPLVAGIFFLSSSIIDVIAGPGYSDAIITLRIKCFAILFAILGYFNMQLVLLPAKKDSLILYATMATGIFNVIANFALISIFKENGAAFATALSELIVFVITKYMMKDMIKLKIGYQNFVQTIVSTAVMIFVVFIVSLLSQNSFFRLFASFVFGLIAYLATQLLLKNQIVIEAFMSLKNGISNHRK